MLKRKKEKATAAKAPKSNAATASGASKAAAATSTGPDMIAKEIRKAEKIVEDINAAMESSSWAQLRAALGRAEKLNVSIRLLKEVPIGKLVKKIGKKAEDKACAEKATAIVSRWKSTFVG